MTFEKLLALRCRHQRYVTTQYLGPLEALLKRPVEEITREGVLELLSGGKRSHNQILTLFSRLAATLSWGKREGLIKENVLENFHYDYETTSHRWPEELFDSLERAARTISLEWFRYLVVCRESAINPLKLKRICKHHVDLSGEGQWKIPPRILDPRKKQWFRGVMAERTLITLQEQMQASEHPLRLWPELYGAWVSDLFRETMRLTEKLGEVDVPKDLTLRAYRDQISIKLFERGSRPSVFSFLSGVGYRRAKRKREELVRAGQITEEQAYHRWWAFCERREKYRRKRQAEWRKKRAAEAKARRNLSDVG